MSLQTINGQTIIEPVTLAALKARLKLTATTDDAQLVGLTTAAREFAERISRQSLAYRLFTYTLDRFPYPHEPIRVPAPPLIALSSITYYDDTLTEQTVCPDEYWTSPAQIPALIVPAPGNVWPCAARVPGAVTLNFGAGYGYPGTDAIPAGPELKPAWVLNLTDIAVFMYENAGAPVPESLVQIPKVYLF